jgi:prophage antirepressor-like protein
VELSTSKTPDDLGAFEFRVTDRDGNPWFVLADVCRVLEIANSRDAASRLDEDERVKIDLSRGVTITDGAKINDL